MPELNRIYREYRDRAAFYVVYIQEAHPVDAWQVRDNLQDDVLLESTTTMDERATAANLCVANLGIQLPALLDDMEGAVERGYTGWPDRLYVIDRDGSVAYKSAAGPFGFQPEHMEAALVRLVPRRAGKSGRPVE